MPLKWLQEVTLLRAAHVTERLEDIGDGRRRASLDLRVRASPEGLSQIHLPGGLILFGSTSIFPIDRV